jgi:hypothetical protein
VELGGGSKKHVEDDMSGRNLGVLSKVFPLISSFFGVICMLY